MHQLVHVRDNMENVTEDEITWFTDWKSFKIPSTITRYKIPDYVCGVSFSSTSPDVLYILTHNLHVHSKDEVFSLNVSTLTLTKMVISGLQSTGKINSLVCHNEFIYIAHIDGVYKCIIEDNSSLRVIAGYYKNLMND